MICRFCDTELSDVFIDLYNSPPSNSFLTREQLNEAEVYFPLKVYTCTNCFLVQLDEFKKSEDIFSQDYVYFSSFSTTWLKHASRYTDLMIESFGYTSSSQVIEIASNDGYLLQYFKEKNVKVLGIEPTANTAAVAQGKGIETIVEFFGVALAEKLVSDGIKADLLLGNNVLAHVPDIRDFVGGMKILLANNGVITMEFPHLLELVNNNQFDTIYHEHFSYLSFYTVNKVFQNAGLTMFDVEELPTHGGSLRIYAKHASDRTRPVSDRVKSMLDKEIKAGITSIAFYTHFTARAQQIKFQLLTFLLEQKRNGKSVAAYGAAAKGNTLLNYCGIKQDLVEFVSDANVHKLGLFLPGSHIPVLSEQHLKNNKPDYVLIFPWNLVDEIVDQLSYIRSWDGKFLTAIPHLQIL